MDGWQKCSETPPSDGQMVIVATRRRSHGIPRRWYWLICPAEHLGGGRFCLWVGPGTIDPEEYANCELWQPLPEAPLDPP